MSLREIDVGAPIGNFTSREERLELADVTICSSRFRPAQSEADSRENLVLMASFESPKSLLSNYNSTYGCFSYMT